MEWIKSVKKHNESVISMCSNYNFLCSGSYDGDVLLWSLKSLELLTISDAESGKYKL